MVLATLLLLYGVVALLFRETLLGAAGLLLGGVLAYLTYRISASLKKREDVADSVKLEVMQQTDSSQKKAPTEPLSSRILSAFALFGFLAWLLVQTGLWQTVAVGAIVVVVYVFYRGAIGLIRSAVFSVSEKGRRSKVINYEREMQKALEENTKLHEFISAVCQTEEASGRQVTTGEIRRRGDSFLLTIARTDAHHNTLSTEQHEFASVDDVSAWLKSNSVLRIQDFGPKA